MKIKYILLIASIVAVILGPTIFFITTDIGMKLAGVILLAVGVLLFFVFILNKGPPK